MLAVSTAKTNSYLDPRTRSAEVLEFESELRQRIVGSHRPEGTTTMFHQSKVAPCRAGRRKTKFVFVYRVEGVVKSRDFHKTVDKSREFGYLKLDEWERVQRICRN